MPGFALNYWDIRQGCVGISSVYGGMRKGFTGISEG